MSAKLTICDIAGLVISVSPFGKLMPAYLIGSTNVFIHPVSAESGINRDESAIAALTFWPSHPQTQNCSCPANLISISEAGNITCSVQSKLYSVILLLCPNRYLKKATDALDLVSPPSESSVLVFTTTAIPLPRRLK